MSDFINRASFYNEVYALDIEVEKYLAGLLFGGSDELSRVIYSGVDYSLRKRSSTSDTQSLDLPFACYKMTGFVEGNSERQWFNNEANTLGYWIEELQRKIRYTPVTIEYEIGVFAHRFSDNVYFQRQLLWDKSNETVLEPLIEVDSTTTLKLPAALSDRGFNFNPRYTRSDWLTTNKIHSIEATLSFETFILLDNTDVTIPETVLLNFVRNKGEETEEIEDLYAATVAYLDETTGEFDLQTS